MANPSTAERVDLAGSFTTAAFLYAELRDLGEGSSAAADLFRFRVLAHTAVEHEPGAAIRTEGRSFFVVFPDAAAAVRCGLEIAARSAQAQADTSALTVAVGIDAGGPAMPKGYLGAAAACAVAGTGEVVVTQAVESRTHNVGVSFALVKPTPLRAAGPEGKLFVARTVGAPAHSVPRWRTAGLARWAALVVVVAIVVAVAGAWWQAHPAGVIPTGQWTIGVLVPKTGDPFGSGFDTQQVNAVRMAITDAFTGDWTTGSALSVDVRDEGDPEATEFTSSATSNFVTDDRVIAIVGPSASSHGSIAIPITNRGGLLDCSPANTSPTLTKPRFGALDLRSAFPARINYVRLAASDDIQGPAAGSYAFNDLGARAALIVDDTSDVGRAVADSFQRSFDSFAPTAGSTVRRALNPGTTDFSDVLEPLRGTGADIGTLYFGGFTFSGAVELKQAMLAMGFNQIPMQSWDGIWDGSGADKGSFIQLAGTAAANTFVTKASIGPVNADFASRYSQAFGVAPSEYAAAAYSCTQVIIDGLRNAAQSGVPAAEMREAVRSYVVDPNHRYQTVLGSVGFDANGDSIQQFVTFYRADPGANSGSGDWITVKQQDFGPAP